MILIFFTIMQSCNRSDPSNGGDAFHVAVELGRGFRETLFAPVLSDIVESMAHFPHMSTNSVAVDARKFGVALLESIHNLWRRCQMHWFKNAYSKSHPIPGSRASFMQDGQILHDKACDELVVLLGVCCASAH